MARTYYFSVSFCFYGSFFLVSPFRSSGKKVYRMCPQDQTGDLFYDERENVLLKKLSGKCHAQMFRLRNNSWKVYAIACFRKEIL